MSSEFSNVKKKKGTKTPRFLRKFPSSLHGGEEEEELGTGVTVTAGRPSRCGTRRQHLSPAQTTQGWCY